MLNRVVYIFIATILILGLLSSCQKKREVPNGYFPYFYGSFHPPKVSSSAWSDFDDLFDQPTDYLNQYELTLSPDYVKRLDAPPNSFGEKVKKINTDKWEIDFYPLDQDLNKNYQYTHRYICKYQPKYYDYANIAYPDPCHGKQYAKAKVVVTNKTDSIQVIDLQMFYQNTSYWHPTDESIALGAEENYRTNYFGGSPAVVDTLLAGEKKVVYLPYIIGKDPKDDSYQRTGLYGPARAGSYEFMLWTKESIQNPVIWQDSIVFWKRNPFADLQKERLEGRQEFWNSSVAYVPSRHFRFKLLNEKFDGANILEPGWVYFLADRDQKPLCDTCIGDFIYNKDIIEDNWHADSFFNGNITKAERIKVPYGNRDENVCLTKDGVFLRIPGSTKQNKQKTWGEFKFMPEFKYGKTKIVAKLAQIRNNASTPTGIIHNLWLYQKRHRKSDTIQGNTYNHLVNDKGKQPFEIDIEVWSKIYEEPWKDVALVNYSIVDYLRNPDVEIGPGEEKELVNGDKIDRINDFQLNYPNYEELYPDFFNDYHLFEIEWSPTKVKFYIDGRLKAEISEDCAKIPDQPCNLWINSPIYQDGTYYNQANIPFFSKDYYSHIRYISIE